MQSTQQRIKKFCDDREWSDPHQIYELLLNMNEEIGEFWNLIKWVDKDTKRELLAKHPEEVENFVGDMIFLVLKIAYIAGVDGQKSIDDVMEEYEQRFPIDKCKGKHANMRAGGVDGKFDV